MEAASRRRGTGIVFAILYAGYASIYAARLNLSTVSPVMLSLGVITKSDLGAMSSVFFFTYAIGQLLNGAIGDKAKPGLMIFTGLCAAGLSNIAIAFLPPVWAMLALWGVNGYAQSMLWGPMLRLLTGMYESKEKRAMRVTMLGTSVALGSVAAIIVSSMLASSADSFGLMLAFMVPGAVTIALGISTLVITKNVGVPAAPSGRISVFKIFTSPAILAVLFPCVAHGVLKDSINVWAPVFFTDNYGIDLEGMAFFVFFIPLISLVGRLIYAPMYKLFKQRDNIVTLIGFIVCVVCTVPLCFSGIPAWLAAVCLSIDAAAVAVINTSFLSIYPMKFALTGNVSLAAGALDFATYMGAGVSSLIYGAVLDGAGFEPMFISWIALLAVSLFFVIRLEKHPASVTR